MRPISPRAVGSCVGIGSGIFHRISAIWPNFWNLRKKLPPGALGQCKSGFIHKNAVPAKSFSEAASSSVAACSAEISPIWPNFWNLYKKLAPECIPPDREGYATDFTKSRRKLRRHRKWHIPPKFCRLSQIFEFYPRIWLHVQPTKPRGFPTDFTVSRRKWHRRRKRHVPLKYRRFGQIFEIYAKSWPPSAFHPTEKDMRPISPRAVGSCVCIGSGIFRRFFGDLTKFLQSTQKVAPRCTWAM